MKILLKICRFLFAILWRAVLTVLIAGAVLLLGVAMVLNLAFNGPSETARDLLTTTLMEYELTYSIPKYFLDQSVIDDICAGTDSTLPEVSDSSLISTTPSFAPAETVPYSGETFTATVTLVYDPLELKLSDTTGENYVGLTSGGILTLATSADSADILDIGSRCGKILIMDGQVNTGLYNTTPSYAQRTAIGQCADGTIVVVTVSGLSENSIGCSYQDLTDIMTEFGAVNACCLATNPLANEE